MAGNFGSRFFNAYCNRENGSWERLHYDHDDNIAIDAEFCWKKAALL